MKDVRKLVPRTPPEGLLEWAAGAKEELDEDVLLIETEWAEDFRLEVILDEWAQRKKVRAIRATCSACTESGLLWRSRDGRGDWGFLHPDSWTEGEGGAVCVDGDRTSVNALEGAGLDLADYIKGETLDCPTGAYKVYRRPPEG